MTGAEAFAAARARADAAKAALDAAQSAMDEAAQNWVREAVVAYSKAHPRRLVTFCAAMGRTNLSVERGGGRHEFDFCNWEPTRFYNGQIVPPPEFMSALWQAADDHDLHNVGSSLLFKCRGGEVLTDTHDW